MLLEHELTIVDEKSLLIVVNNDHEQWLLNVNNCEQWLLTTVVEHCAAQHCNKLLTTLINVFIFACVACLSWSVSGGIGISDKL